MRSTRDLSLHLLFFDCRHPLPSLQHRPIVVASDTLWVAHYILPIKLAMEPDDVSLITRLLQDLSLSDAGGDTNEAALVEDSASLVSRTRAQFDGLMISQEIQSLSPRSSTTMAMTQSEHPAPRGGSVSDNCTFNLMLYGLVSIANQHDKYYYERSKYTCQCNLSD
jgi:hypothetical protein